MARLTPFETGQIKVHLHHGLGVTAISGLVTKTDGASVSAQSYGSHGIATLMSGAIPLTCHLRVIRVIRPVIRCK